MAVSKQELDDLAARAAGCIAQGDYAEAVRLCLQCYAGSAALGYRHGSGRALLHLGQIAQARDHDYALACALFLCAPKYVKGGWYITAYEFWQECRHAGLHAGLDRAALYDDRAAPEDLIRRFTDEPE